MSIYRRKTMKDSKKIKISTSQYIRKILSLRRFAKKNPQKLAV